MSRSSLTCNLVEGLVKNISGMVNYVRVLTS